MISINIICGSLFLKTLTYGINKDYSAIFLSLNAAHFFGIIQSSALFRNRLKLAETVSSLEESFKFLNVKLERNKIRKIKVLIYLTCLAIITVHCVFTYVEFNFSETLYPEFLKNITSFLLGDNRSSEILRRCLVFMNCFSYQMAFTWFHCFLLYYCTVCWFLEAAFSHYRILLQQEIDVDRLSSLHTIVSKTVLAIDDVFARQVFWSCAFLLGNAFLYGYSSMRLAISQLVYGDIFLCFWSILSFVVLITFASLVNESVNDIKTDCQLIDFKFSHTLVNGLVLKITQTDVQLSIWKIVPMQRVTILNVLGAFFTYAVIIAAY
ncbi:hypothetical protein CDAR_420571 [Caerostris darwini]|uniref:Gustatory receptor n=1 Tax=Caerostris darwini TaxID=1538125 RepID=A0AAV4QCQ0_9ARAC|nr:hypothetical protein CDAR_420571 [Caerostris darwini]